MRIVNTLRLAKGEVFFGPGPKQLLLKIQEYSSLRQATIDTGISYTKALKIIKRMEAQLGFAVVESEKGGNARGGTRLTDKGLQLLQDYIEVERQVNEYAKKMVEKQLAWL